jgi:hypothetical protein
MITVFKFHLLLCSHPLHECQTRPVLNARLGNARPIEQELVTTVEVLITFLNPGPLFDHSLEVTNRLIASDNKIDILPTERLHEHINIP